MIKIKTAYFKFNKDLYTKFKSVCVLKDITMTEVLENFMEKYIKKNENEDKDLLQTNNDKSTNNYILRLKSPSFFNKKYKLSDNIFKGTLQNAQTKEVGQFNNVFQFHTLLHKWFKKDEEK